MVGHLDAQELRIEETKQKLGDDSHQQTLAPLLEGIGSRFKTKSKHLSRDASVGRQEYLRLRVSTRKHVRRSKLGDESRQHLGTYLTNKLAPLLKGACVRPSNDVTSDWTQSLILANTRVAKEPSPSVGPSVTLTLRKRELRKQH